MLTLQLKKKTDAPFGVLCLGAHCDDIEIGCGGTILRLLSEIDNTFVRWVVFTSDAMRAREARSSAELFLQKARRKTVTVQGLETSFLPFAAEDVKRYFVNLKAEFSPDLIFTHYRHDLHQDHRLVCELTWNTFRDHLILEYEILKYDGDLGSPNFFVPLSKEACAQKIQNILQSFPTQRDKHWFTADAFRAILRLRGIEACAAEGHAEAFYCRKLTL